MQIFSLRQLATRSALLLTLGLGLAACDKALEVEPRNSISSDTGFKTKEDAAAGLLGAYDAVQNASYYGISYPAFADLISGNILHVGTFNTTYGAVGQNQVLPDNIELGNTWNVIYNAINRANYVIQQSEAITDPAFAKNATLGEARALRAFHYMNLLAFWGGTTEGYGYPNGLGVPLRLTPTTEIGEPTKPTARASEAEVVAAIRADLDFAIANLPVGNGNRITKNSAQALRARLELRMRNYTDALTFALQVPATAGFNAAGAVTAAPANDAIWRLFFSPTDQNAMAFYWFPSTAGGRNEFDPTPSLIAAHPTGDLRRVINSQTSPTGTTAKFVRTSTGDDQFSMVRYSEVVLTLAEAYARTGDLVNAKAKLDVIRLRAGLAPTTAETEADLITDIMLQRRLELAYEGHYWFDLRRTNMIQTAIPAYEQAFRNVLPIPQREVQVSGGIVTQNPGY
ncbi:RagB/SusD family nutrient uptake outer membrane protein [Hymenobacter seoulensis]